MYNVDIQTHIETNMNSLQLLLVRACKTRDPQKRLESVYRRYYYNGGMQSADMVSILNNICREYIPNSSEKLINNLNPAQAFMYGCDKNTPYFDLCLKVLISHIRLTAADDIPGYKYPCWVYNQYK